MAAARAAARRQAILSSRGNRLAKLTSSARGDDPGGVYAIEDPPLPTIGGTGLENFVGEETLLPTPLPSSTPSKSQPHIIGTSEAKTERNSNQQQELIRALMDGIAGQTGLGSKFPMGEQGNAEDGPSVLPTLEDPLSALFTNFGSGKDGDLAREASPPLRPRIFLEKLVPVLHILSMIGILVWFIGWKEPVSFAETRNLYAHNIGEKEFEKTRSAWNNERWTRWARLARDPTVEGMTVPSLPNFFWVFITLQLALHSLRLASQPDGYRPPMLIGFIILHLPPSFSRTILTCLRYIQMGSMILDDLAILIFGIGLVVFVSSNWMT